jgi:hypothetical protein
MKRRSRRPGAELGSCAVTLCRQGRTNQAETEGHERPMETAGSSRTVASGRLPGGRRFMCATPQQTAEEERPPYQRIFTGRDRMSVAELR